MEESIETELDRFRAEWKQEVAKQRTQAVAATEQVSTSSTSNANASNAPLSPKFTTDKLSKAPTAASAPIPLRSHLSQRPTPQNALQHYETAVLAEAEGVMHRAVKHYRIAFKLDSDVDKAYHKQQQAQSQSTTTMDDELAFQFARTVQVGPDYIENPVKATDEEHPHATSRYLRKLKESFEANPYEFPDGSIAEEVDFLPHNTLRPLRLRKLPDELISQVLLETLLPTQQGRFPKIGQVEAFALVCRKARLMTLSDTKLYRSACRIVYRPPYQVAPSDDAEEDSYWDPDPSDDSVCDSLCEKLYHGDWRRFWVEHPRLRTDGCFISVVQYVRRGENDNAWIAPSHIVVYYRFLRFLPNGQCISLVTTLSPSEIARSLDIGLRMKGLSIGRWQLRGDQIECWGLEDVALESPKYTLEAQYRLRSTSRGKMNKLVLNYLRTENKTTGERLDVDLQHNRSFYFSCVRSYEN